MMWKTLTGGKINNMNIIDIIKRWIGVEEHPPEPQQTFVMFANSQQLLEYIQKITQEVLNDK